MCVYELGQNLSRVQRDITRMRKLTLHLSGAIYSSPQYASDNLLGEWKNSHVIYKKKHYNLFNLVKDQV